MPRKHSAELREDADDVPTYSDLVSVLTGLYEAIQAYITPGSESPELLEAMSEARTVLGDAVSDLVENFACRTAPIRRTDALLDAATADPPRWAAFLKDVRTRPAEYWDGPEPLNAAEDNLSSPDDL